MTAISSSSMTGGGGTKTGRRGTMVGWGCGLALAAGWAAAAVLAAAAGLAGGLVAVWAHTWEERAETASRVAAPTETSGTIGFISHRSVRAHRATRASPLY